MHSARGRERSSSRVPARELRPMLAELRRRSSARVPARALRPMHERSATARASRSPNESGREKDLPPSPPPPSLFFLRQGWLAERDGVPVVLLMPAVPGPVQLVRLLRGRRRGCSPQLRPASGQRPAAAGLASGPADAGPWPQLALHIYRV